MPEKTKREKDSQKSADEKTKKAPAEKKDAPGNWGDDQRGRSYYYDDAHGYEIYKPEDDDEPENAE